MYWIPNPNAIVLAVGASGKWLDHKSHYPLMKGINVLVKRAHMECSFGHMKTQLETAVYEPVGVPSKDSKSHVPCSQIPRSSEVW